MPPARSSGHGCCQTSLTLALVSPTSAYQKPNRGRRERPSAKTTTSRWARSAKGPHAIGFADGGRARPDHAQRSARREAFGRAFAAWVISVMHIRVSATMCSGVGFSRRSLSFFPPISVRNTASVARLEAGRSGTRPGGHHGAGLGTRSASRNRGFSSSETSPIARSRRRERCVRRGDSGRRRTASHTFSGGVSTARVAGSRRPRSKRARASCSG